MPLRCKLRLNQQFFFHDISGRFQRLPSEPWSLHNVYVQLHRSMFQSSLLSSSFPPTSSFALHFLLDSVIFSLFLSSFLFSLLSAHSSATIEAIEAIETVKDAEGKISLISLCVGVCVRVCAAWLRSQPPMLIRS